MKNHRKEWEAVVVHVRLVLYNKGLPCGARAIRNELNQLGVSPLPSERTIGRILVRKSLTHSRTGYYPEEHCI